jgi:hypothetical protein
MAVVMKRCSSCGETRPYSEFHKNAAFDDGHQGYCKPCRKAYDHDYHLRVRDRRVEQKRAARHRRTEWLRQLREGIPCTDCRNVYPFFVMHWDHLPEFQKLGEISGSLRNHAAAKILAEIGKCELVCANCHAIRTYNRFHGVAEESAVYAYQLAA